VTMNSTYYGMNTCQAMPNDAKRSRPLGKKVAKKRRQAGLVADGRRASPRTNVIAVRCGPPADAPWDARKGPSCRCLIALSTLRVQWRVLSRAHGGSRVTVA